MNRNWYEDEGHENGNYVCICHNCKEEFIGHKRRVTCKVCVHRGQIEALEPMDDEELVKIKEQLEMRWLEKPWYGFDPKGPDKYGSPGCSFRAHEILRMIKRLEQLRDQRDAWFASFSPVDED